MQKLPIIILSAPSGCGKDTVYNHLRDYDFAPTEKVITSTSRWPRENNGILEEHGREYYFYTKEDFEAGIAAGDFLEHENYAGNYYGSTWKELARINVLGRTPLYNVEVKGAATLTKTLKEKYTVVSVFLLPPSKQSLEWRLRGRGSDDEEAIQKRLARATLEIKSADQYEICLVNHSSADTAKILGNIINDALAGAPDSELREYDERDQVDLTEWNI
jgi:guanylate kinase